MSNKLNLSALTGKRRPQGWPDPRHSWTAPGAFSLSRRGFVLGSAVAAASISPMARAAVTAIAPFAFTYEGGVATFSLQGKPCWAIDPRRFAGTPQLQVEEGANDAGERWLRLTLSGARFPGLSLPADFKAEIQPAMLGSTLILELALGSFRAELPFESWLAGLVPAESTVQLNVLAATLASGCDLRLAGRATASLNPNWQMTWQEQAIGRLTFRGEAFPADAVTLALLPDGAESLLNSRVRRRSMLVLERRQQEWPAWPLTPGEASGQGLQLQTSTGSFDLLRVEAAESRTGETGYGLVAESMDGSGQASLRVTDGRLTQENGEPLTVPITQVQAALAFDPSGDELEVTGRFLPAVAMAGTCCLTLGDDAQNPGFALQARGDRLTALHAAPAVLDARLPMEGALVQEVRVPPGVRLTLAEAASKVTVAVDNTAVSLRGINTLLPLSSVSVIRPSDMVNLRFDFFNLALQVEAGGTAALTRQNSAQAAHIVVHFPPQHLAEQTYSVVYGDPSGLAGARIADPSRVAFMLPPEVTSIPYRLDALLDWKSFQLSVRETMDLKNRPDETVTAIEAPYRLWLSPVAGSAFINATLPATNPLTGRTELWHTRMGLIEEGTIRETSLNELALRAIWSRDIDKAPTPINQVADFAGLTDPVVGAFASTLNVQERGELIGLTSDPSLAFGDPVLTRRLMLSSLGAWLDAKGSWDVGGSSYSLRLWEHQMLMARDQYVRTENLGFLFPFGHLCSLVTVTNREFSESGIAYLNRRSYIIVHEPVKEYNDRQLPFQQIEILDDKSPLLSDNRDGFGLGDGAFWPKVGADAAPFYFRAVAVDWDGNEIPFQIWLPYVKQSVAVQESLMTGVRNTYNADGERIRELKGLTVAYVPAPEPDVEPLPEDPEDERVSTSFPTDRIRLLAVAPPWASDPTVIGPRFRLVMETADIHLDQVENLSEQPALTTVRYHPTYLANGFASPANQGQVYLELLTAVPTNLPADGLAGMINPDFKVTAISRTIGSIGGNVAGMATGFFDTGALWPGNQSTLLNLFSLKSIFPGVNFIQSTRSAAGLPPWVSWIPRPIFSRIREKTNAGTSTPAPPPPSTTPDPKSKTTKKTPKKKPKKQTTGYKVGFSWKPQGLLRSFPSQYPIFTAYAEAHPPEILQPTQLLVELTKVIQKKRKKGATAPPTATKKKPGPSFTIGVRNFKLSLRWFKSPYQELFSAWFWELSATRADGQTKMNVLITKFAFGGPLQFFNELAKRMQFQAPDSTADDAMPEPESKPTKPPMLELFQYLPPLPAFSIGAFGLSNIKIGGGVGIPLQKNAPDGMEFQLAVGEKWDPFSVNVSYFGGGGSLGFAFTPNRLTMVQGSIEVGLVARINIAVVKGSMQAVIGIHVRAEFPAPSNPDLPGAIIELTGYVRVSGELRLLGIVTISALFLLVLVYNSYDKSLSGTATLHFKVKILFFSKKVSVTVRRVFYSESGRGSAAVGDGTTVRRPLSAERKAQYINAYADAFYS